MIGAMGTDWILAVTVVISVLGLYKLPKLIAANLFKPYYIVREDRYFTFVSSGFVHANAAHLFFNMLTFYFFGPALERVIGSARLVVLYIIALVFSQVRTYFQRRNDPTYASLGASGAVSAVLFATIVYFPNQSLYILPIPIAIPAPLFAVCYLAYSWYLSRHRQDRINHSAHIDGAVTGLLYVASIDPQAYEGLANYLASGV